MDPDDDRSCVGFVGVIKDAGESLVASGVTLAVLWRDDDVVACCALNNDEVALVCELVESTVLWTSPGGESLASS